MSGRAGVCLKGLDGADRPALGRGLADVLGVQPEVSAQPLAPSRTCDERRAAAERYRNRRNGSGAGGAVWMAGGLLVLLCLMTAWIG